MGYGAPTPSDSPQEARQFEILLEQFESRLNDSNEISQGLYEKICRLRYFQIEVDNVKTTEKLKEPEGLVSSLAQAIERIDYLNKRNIEILKHLNTLI